MTLLLLEGFGAYSTGAHPAFSGGDEMLGNWTTKSGAVTLTSLESGSAGNKKYLTSTTTPTMTSQSFTSSSSLVVGFRFYYTGSSGRIIEFFDAGSRLCGIAISQTGVLHINKNTSGYSDFNFTATQALKVNTWTYVECEITFHDSTGSIDWHLNGIAAGSYSNIDTIAGGTECDKISVGYNMTGEDWHSGFRIADIYVDTATAHGPMDIWTQACDAAGSAANFTPSAGSNYQNVDEIGPDDDTTYNSSTATTTKDQIATSDTTPAAPLAVQPVVRGRYIPTGSANLKVGLKSGATEDQDSAVAIDSAYANYHGKIYETDPNTSSAWTVSNADSSEVSYEHA